MDTPSPKIILQTKSVRVIHIPRGPTSLPESAGKLDNILFERRSRDGLGELYWERFIELTWTESQSALGDLMHSMFNQMVGDVDPELFIQTSLGALPIVKRPTTKYGLGQLLEALVACIFTPSEHGNGMMPFDNRDGIIGMDVPPSMRESLAHLFPRTRTSQDSGPPSPTTIADLVRRLLRAAAQELTRE